MEKHCQYSLMLPHMTKSFWGTRRRQYNRTSIHRSFEILTLDEYQCRITLLFGIASTHRSRDVRPVLIEVVTLDLRLGPMMLNMIWYDMIYDMAWHGMAWHDMTWYDIWYDMIWYDMIWYDMIWYDMIWYDMIWYDTIRYDTIRYDMQGSDQFMNWIEIDDQFNSIQHELNSNWIERFWIGIELELKAWTDRNWSIQSIHLQFKSSFYKVEHFFVCHIMEIVVWQAIPCKEAYPHAPLCVPSMGSSMGSAGVFGHKGIKITSRTVDATERTRFSRSRPNDLQNIGQGQRSLHATHPLMLMMICAKYGKNASRVVAFFQGESRRMRKKCEKLKF